LSHFGLSAGLGYPQSYALNLDQHTASPFAELPQLIVNLTQLQLQFM
jgi:hypothetical protein